MHFEQTGHKHDQNPDLFLIHGWLMNLRCWDGIVARLKERYRLTLVDLPGHGGSLDSAHSFARPQRLVAELLRLAPDDAVWVGWSLGGLLAQQAAQAAPERFRALVSVGMGARCTAFPDWPYAMNRALFGAASCGFAGFPEPALRFLIERQLFGIDRNREVRAAMNVLAAMPWDKKELRAALKFLKSADARDAIRGFDKPALFIAGEKDLLTGVESLRQSSRLAPRGRCVEIAAAGHAPFLSQPAEFTAALDGFIRELD